MSDPKVTTESAAISGNTFVSATCGGEVCRVCGRPATRKVGEEIPWNDPMHGQRHNLTAYVCDNHFNAIFSPRCDPGPTVRVRIAVAVDATGRYKAAGWGGGVDSVKLEIALKPIQQFGEVTSLVWVEADVPLPLAPQTIRGQVTSAEEG